MSTERIWQLVVCTALLQSPLRAQATAVIRGRILTDSAERPIAGAEVALADRRFGATSDSLGRFRIAGVPPGRYAIRVRRLGYAPASATVTLTPNDSTEADFLLAAVAQELPTVEVETTLLQRKLADFEERRRFGIGHFLNEAEIQKAPGTRMSEKLRHLPGLRLLYPRSGSNVTVASTRGQQSILLQRPGPCLSAVVLDGAVDLGTGFNVNSIEPGEVIGLEWFAGPAQIPARYGGTRNGCGLLIIWTK